MSLAVARKVPEFVVHERSPSAADGCAVFEWANAGRSGNVSWTAAAWSAGDHQPLVGHRSIHGYPGKVDPGGLVGQVDQS